VQPHITDTTSGGARTGYADPQWVIVGSHLDDGTVMVIASKTLSRATLDVRARQVREMSLHDMFSRDHSRPEISLMLIMDEIVMIQAVNYPAAFEALFRQWSPPGRPDPTLPAIGR
jgi:hypothetical protein